MTGFIDAFHTALRLIATLDPQLIEIVLLSLQVSLLAVVAASLIGFALGGALAVYRFPGRGMVTAVLSALMGLPPVVAGLIVYLLLSNAGPLGVLQLLYTPTAMIVGGNIDHVTRTMTTAIALETSKGNIALALALGIVLLVIAFAVNAALMGVRRFAVRLAYA